MQYMTLPDYNHTTDLQKFCWNYALPQNHATYGVSWQHGLFVYQNFNRWLQQHSLQPKQCAPTLASQDKTWWHQSNQRRSRASKTVPQPLTKLNRLAEQPRIKLSACTLMLNIHVSRIFKPDLGCENHWAMLSSIQLDLRPNLTWDEAIFKIDFLPIPPFFWQLFPHFEFHSLPSKWSTSKPEHCQHWRCSSVYIQIAP